MTETRAEAQQKGLARIIDAARLVVSDYPVAAGQMPDVMTGERGYGSIKKLSDALVLFAAEED